MGAIAMIAGCYCSYNNMMDEHCSLLSFCNLLIVLIISLHFKWKYNSIVTNIPRKLKLKQNSKIIHNKICNHHF